MSIKPLVARVADEPHDDDRIKVHVTFRNGEYSLQEFTPAHEAAGLHWVEISRYDWRGYQALQDEIATWHVWARDLGNQQHAKETA